MKHDEKTWNYHDTMPKNHSARTILLSQIKNCVSSDKFKKGPLQWVRYLDHMQVNKLAESKYHKRLMTSCYVTQWHTLDTLHLTSSQKADNPEKAIVSSRLSINIISFKEKALQKKLRTLAGKL